MGSSIRKYIKWEDAVIESTKYKNKVYSYTSTTTLHDTYLNPPHSTEPNPPPTKFTNQYAAKINQQMAFWAYKRTLKQRYDTNIRAFIDNDVREK